MINKRIDASTTLYVREDKDDWEIAKEIFDRNYYFEWGMDEGLGIEKGDVVVDLGANAGAFTVKAVQFAPKIIYAYEPEPTVFEVLKRNAERYSNVVVHKQAVGKEYDYVDFYKNEYSGDHSLYKRDKTSEVIKVRQTTLDRIFAEKRLDVIDFLKIDVEGAEYEILENCTRLKDIKQISMEWHLGLEKMMGLISLLTDNGFRVVWFEGRDERGKLQLINEKIRD